MKTCTPGHNSCLFLPALLALICACSGVQAGEMILRAEQVEAAHGAEVEIPVIVSGAGGMEGLQFVLGFDPELLEYTAVKLAPLAGAGTVDAKVRQPGEIRIAMYPEKTLQDAGTLLVAHFTVLGSAGDSAAVELTAARAWDFGSGYPLEMLVVAESGAVAVVQSSGLPLYVLGAGGLILALVVTGLIRRKRQG